VRCFCIITLDDDPHSETPGLADNRPSKRRRVTATDNSGTDDDMDNFFRDDTAAADQHDEENKTHNTRPSNDGELAVGGNIPPPFVFVILC
jgi:hypothetical protein